MAIVNSADDPKPPVDALLRDVLKNNPEVALKLRVQPTFYDASTRNHRTWTDVSWLLELEGIEEALRLREGLQDFFVCFGHGKKQDKMLAEIKRLAGRG